MYTRAYDVATAITYGRRLAHKSQKKNLDLAQKPSVTFDSEAILILGKKR